MSNQIIIEDKSQNLTLNIEQPITQVIEVIGKGPKGDKGESGDSIFTPTENGFYQTTSSIQISDTLVVYKGITGSLEGTSSFSVSSSYAQTSKFSPNYTLTSSFNSFTGSYSTGSFTGSFTGSLKGTNSTLYNTSLTGDTLITGSLTISSSQNQTPATFQIYGDISQKGGTFYQPVNLTINPNLSGSYIFSSGSTNDLYFAQSTKGYTNITRLRWLEGNLYTGLLNGGLITSASATTFNISSGSGLIVNLNASLNDSPYPTVEYINWDNITNQPLTYLTSSIQTFLGIGPGGVLIQQTKPWNDGQYNNSISLGTVLHQNKSTINAVTTYPNVAYGYKQRTYDFIKAFGPLKLSGLEILPSSSLELTVSSGTAWADGRNYQVDPNNPSYIIDTGTNVSKIVKYYQSGSDFVRDTNNGLGYPTIDPSLYNPGGSGSLQPVPGTGNNRQFTLQRVFWYPNSATKNIVVYYGNNTYPTLTDAIANIQYERFLEDENTKQNAVYLGAIAIRNNGNFNDSTSYSILPGGIFRNVGGSGGGGTAPSARFVDLSDVTIAAPTNLQPIVYNSSLDRYVNSSTISASLEGNAKTATSASYADTSSYTTAISGSTNYISKFTGNSTLGSSLIYDNGTNIGIGSIPVSEKLEVGGYVKATGFKTPSGILSQALTANGGVYDLTTKADLVGGKVPKAQSQSSTMVMDSSTYVITFTDATGAVQSIDLPLESLFKDANYDETTKSLIVTLQDGTTRTIPLSDLVDLPEIVLATSNPAVTPTSGQKVYFNTSLGKVWFNVSGAWVFGGNLISDTEKTNLSTAYTHSQTTGNPHNTTKSDIGLGNVDNTSDLNKPISNATQLALNSKQNILTNPVTGTGTANYLSKFTGSGTIGNSQIFDDGTNVGVGTTSPSSKLEINPLENQTALKISNYSVTGSNNQPALDINGTWNTTGIPTLIKANVTNTASGGGNLIDLQRGGISQFRVTRDGFLVTNSLTAGAGNITGDFGFQGAFGLRLATSGNQSVYRVDPNSGGFIPTSGTATYAVFLANPTINQTGGANGITRGLYINPTLTSAADWRSIEWSNNTGYGLYGSGSANNFLAGNLGIGMTSPQAKLDVKAQGALSTDTAFRVRNSTDTVNLIELNGLGRLGLGVSPTSKFDIQAEQDTAILSAESLTSSGWTATGWTGDFTTGFTHTTGNTSVLSNSFTPANNTLYQVLITISGRTTGNIIVNFGGITQAGITATTNISQRTSSTSNLQITPTSDFNGTISVSIKTISAYGPALQFRNANGFVTNEVRLSSLTSNTFVGINTGRVNTTGINNSFFGYQAGQNNTTGYSNSFFGYTSGLNNTTGYFNSFFGSQAGVNSTTGNANSFFGVQTGQSNTTGGLNSFFGTQAGQNNTTGNFNSFFGYTSGLNNTTGYNNSFFGTFAGYNNTTGYNNLFFGYQAGRYISNGNNLTIANNSVFIGYDTRANADNETNQIVIGSTAIGNGSNSVTLGNDSITKTILKGNVGIGTTIPSEKLEVNGNVKASGFKKDGGTATQALTADGGVFDLNEKANIDDIPTKTSFTHDILVSNWTLVSGKYEAVISNAVILANSFVDVIPSNDNVDIVRNAQIYPSVLISAGSVKVYSKFLPSGTISVTVNIN